MQGKLYDGRLLRRLAFYVKPYRKQVAATVVLLTIHSLLESVGPVLTAIAIDRFLVQRAFRLYPTYAVGLGLTCGIVALYAATHDVPFKIRWNTYLENASLCRDWFKGDDIDGIVWTVAGGNDGALLRLLKGEVDFGYVGVTNVKADYADKNPALNLYWWPVNNANFLYLNNAKAPFNDLNFRRAIAMAVDTKDVAQKGYNGTVAAADPSGVIPAQRGKWLTAAATKNAYTFNLEKAKAALSKAGYKTDSSCGLLGKDGKSLGTLKILVGAGWTDFIAMAQVVSENLKKIGLTTSIDQQQWSGYAGALQTGTYDMGISWGWGNGDTPYDLFYKSFSPELSAAPFLF